MQKVKFWLISLLAVQVVLSALLWIVPNINDQHHQASPLFRLAQQDVDKIIIEQNDKKIILENNKQQWQLADQAHLPADNNKITAILSKLAALKTSWPVATSESAQARFKVAENNNKRHVQLYRGTEMIADFYLGTTPGFHKNHLRRQGDRDIYALAVNLYDFSSNEDYWLDKKLLAANNLTEINGQNFQLSKKSASSGETADPNKKSFAQWQFDLPAVELTVQKNNNASEAAREADREASNAILLDQSKTTDLVNSLQSLTVLKQVNTTLDNVEFTLASKAEKRVLKWQFQHKGDDYLVARNDIPAVFSMMQSSYETLQKTNKNSLLAVSKNSDRTISQTHKINNKITNTAQKNKASLKKNS